LVAQALVASRRSEKRAAAAPGAAQITEDVQALVPLARNGAIAKAFSAGTKRIFLTVLPRFPKNCRSSCDSASLDPFDSKVTMTRADFAGGACVEAWPIRLRNPIPSHGSRRKAGAACGLRSPCELTRPVHFRVLPLARPQRPQLCCLTFEVSAAKLYSLE